MKSAHNMKGKGQRPHINKQMDGKGKSDDHFQYNMTIIIGCSAEVTTRDGEVYEGIFVAFSAAMEILLEAAHLVTDSKDDASSIEKHFDVLVIPSEKVVSMKCVNADLTYPTREFATDTAISSGRGGNGRDKELTPWECSEDTPDDLTLDQPATGGGGGGGGTSQNGWEAKDMFKKNEEKYGVVSTFNHDLSGYTTKVDKNDTAEFKRLEEQANQIAAEIERGTSSWERSQVENGDEEEAYSAVVRPRNTTSISSVNNNNNNNTSSVANDKYIPPSRRQTNMQPSAPPPTQSHPPSNNNGPSHTNNNSGIARKPMYNQNQAPRNNYGPPPNAVYHQDRRNFDSRRAPLPNQYGNSASHGEVRRPEDSGPRPRMNNKVPMDRKDPAKLKEFGNTFRLQQSDMRRPQGNPPPQVGMPPHALATATNSAAPIRNPSPPSAPAAISSNKVKKEESAPSLPPLISSNAASESVNPPPASSPLASANSTIATTSTPSAVSASASPSTPSVANVSVSESTPTSTSSLTSPSENPTPSSTGDSKAGEAESKKKFAFNPNAKEFNPKSFTSRSPSTPPRPPSTPATAATPQVVAAQALHSFMPISMQPTLLYAPATPYAQAAALTPSSNSSTSSGVTTPRHGGHRKGGMVGMPPRSEMTPPVQMTSGPHIMAPATAIQAAPSHTQYFLPQGHYAPVMRVVPGGVAMPVFPTESSGGTQIHPQMHYLPPNGANPQNNSVHQQNNSPQSNPSAPTNVVPSNGHGYGQTGGSHSGGHHVGYPIVGVGVPVAYGFPQAPPNVIQVPYVPHQGGTATVIPQSQ